MILVIPAGVEPAAYALGKRRSIQLSYGIATTRACPRLRRGATRSARRPIDRRSARRCVGDVAEAVEQPAALRLLAGADFEDADLARRVVRSPAGFFECGGVLLLDGRGGVLIELRLADLAGGEIGLGILDGARSQLGA